MADIARMDYRIKLSFIGKKWGLIIEYRLNFKPTFWTGLPPFQGWTPAQMVPESNRTRYSTDEK